MDILNLSAQQLLLTTSPEKLFSYAEFEIQFKRLRMKWHPDRNSDAQATIVFDHINKLAEQAEQKKLNGMWNGDATIQFISKGSTYRFRYRKVVPFELGKMYIGNNIIMYVIDEEFDDLFRNGVNAIRSIKYPNSKFEGQFKKLFPTIKLADANSSIGRVLVIEKTDKSVLLQNWIDYESGKLNPKCTAWVIGALYNITTFLDSIGLCHNSILPTTVFVDPANHAVYLLGGWWYSTKQGDKLKAVPSELLKILPGSLFDDKTSKTIYDRQAVKGVAIACLGDPSMVGSKLLTDKDIPALVVSQARSPSSPNALDDFRGWYRALEKSYGKRKFVKCDIDIDKLY